MKGNKVIKILLIPVIIVLLLMFQFGSNNEKNNQPNIISQKQDTIETSVNQNETSQPNPVKDLQADENLAKIKVKKPLSDKAFSYLALYRDIRFLSTCHIGANSLMTANSVKKLKQNR
ncbi:hypothetical protein MNBD_GAMMA02-1632, partial [hydrothermal vent metagenome]